MSIPLTSGVHHDARPHNVRSLHGVIVQLESLLLGLYGKVYLRYSGYHRDMAVGRECY